MARRHLLTYDHSSRSALWEEAIHNQPQATYPCIVAQNNNTGNPAQSIFSTAHVTMKSSNLDRVTQHLLSVSDAVCELYEIQNSSRKISIVYNSSSPLGPHYNPRQNTINFRNVGDIDFDVVAHETGHAILFLNGFFAVANSDDFVKFQVNVAHETFADLTAGLSTLFIDEQFGDAVNSIVAKDEFGYIGVIYAYNNRRTKYGEYLTGIRRTLGADELTMKKYHDFSTILSEFIVSIFRSVVFKRLNMDFGNLCPYSGTFVVRDFARELLEIYKNVAINDDLLFSIAYLLGKRVVERGWLTREAIKKQLRSFEDKLLPQLNIVKQASHVALSQASAQQTPSKTKATCVMS